VSHVTPQTQARREPRVLLAIATAGRRSQMPLTLARLSQLDPLPGHVAVVPATPADFEVPAPGVLPFPLIVLTPAAKGSTVQRNAVLDALGQQSLGGADILLFIDDDFYPCKDYIRALVEAFDRCPDAVGFTGRPMLDGATGPGIGHDAALEALQRADAGHVPVVDQQTYGTYGCNMAFRTAAISKAQARFEEALPLYGWLEDIDFSRQVATTGTIRESTALRGVHLGTKSGRVSGRKFGYSQIANPLFCVRKGTMSWRYAVRQMSRNVLMNLARLMKPEPWIDRRGRVSGNALAIVDACRGRVRPERAATL
jgi:hypothetical protein